MGEPMPGIDVSVEQNPGGIIASTRTDAEGNFSFGELPAGSYQLVCSPASPSKSFGDAARAGRPGVVSVTVPVAVNLKTGRSRQVYAVAEDGGAISGNLAVVKGREPAAPALDKRRR